MTKLLADENIPRKTVEILKNEDLDITSVSETSPGLSDRAVIEQANKENRIIITFDKDFGELIFKERLKVKGLILLRIAPASPEHIAERIRHTLSQVPPLENKIVTVREDRTRATPLRRPIE